MEREKPNLVARGLEGASQRGEPLLKKVSRRRAGTWQGIARASLQFSLPGWRLCIWARDTAKLLPLGDLRPEKRDHILIHIWIYESLEWIKWISNIADGDGEWGDFFSKAGAIWKELLATECDNDQRLRSQLATLIWLICLFTLQSAEPSLGRKIALLSVLGDDAEPMQPMSYISS